LTTLASHSIQFDGISGDALEVLVESVIEYISNLSTSLSQQPNVTLEVN